jgi:hypothetical protein
MSRSKQRALIVWPLVVGLAAGSWLMERKGALAEIAE